MKTYTMFDNRGKEIEIEESQMYRHFKLLIMPVLTEMGLTAEMLTNYEGDLYRLVGLMVAHVRTTRSSLDVARKEFAKIRKQREADYELILKFLRTANALQTPSSFEADNVVSLDREAA